MAWPTPQFTRKEVSRAGRTLARSDASDEDTLRAISVLSNWRACHGYPINTFQATLRTRLKRVDASAFVAQRLKRLPSIVAKLKRYPEMDLARMQDIGGLRAVVKDVDSARRLHSVYVNKVLQHDLLTTSEYILTPKDSGYRSIHLVYKYRNKETSAYDGLRLELQIRTQIQHAWAMAVETAGMMLNQALKASRGSEAWLDFFALASSAFAHLEGAACVQRHAHLSKADLFDMVRARAAALSIEDTLLGLAHAAKSIRHGQIQGSYFLIVLNPESRVTTMQAFARDRLGDAITRYNHIEEEIASGKPLHAVLVSSQSMQALEEAYPSYFLNATQFLTHLKPVLHP
ncbi:MAG: RelA/SpoT domain-containing protein [Phycisphaeraceae bacterium]|nr:RelA/SpoT domain-containing protein [Phycisphaeraceae bacterium]MBX3368182.1 RelA/SpoT domain-containing protein [Phycisphaeraceae bacterium]